MPSFSEDVHNLFIVFHDLVDIGIGCFEVGFRVLSGFLPCSFRLLGEVELFAVCSVVLAI
jgi:hypothetical protein